ncbi:MAG: hypothetical protein M9894_31610 [Planctomycetes bacterium]|nr:hypothetical protein [Planctomycetota bacterium]
MTARRTCLLAAVSAFAGALAGAAAAQDPGVAPVASPTVAATSSATRAAGHAPPRMRGMALPLHAYDPAHDYASPLAELPPLGVTHVAMFVHLWQRDGQSPAPRRHPLRTPSDRILRATIARARALGLEVALVPSVLLERPAPDDWRGNLRPPSWAGWFQGYRRELLHLARLAEDEGVALLAVGSELSSTDGHEALWRALIADVRAEFSGALTYSANWDHYERVRFWDALDQIGLSAYFELSRAEDPTVDDLTAAWAAQRAALEAFRLRRGLLRQPLVLLEVGYPSVEGCASKPWDYAAPGRVDLEAQRRCYAAFAAAWADAPPGDLAGVFFYEWWGEGGRRDRGYTPRGKPALEVVKGFFAR